MNFFKKNKILIILGIILGAFLIPQFAHADAFGVMDIFGMQLDALDFLDNSVRQYLVFTTLILSESMIFLSLAGNLADWAINFSVDLMHNAVVVGGWEFMVGISNLIIIISFVWTGLSMILNGDSAQGQRRLFTLIGLALIVNFSLFIMGALVDIAGYIQGSIINVFSGDKGSFTSQSYATLMNISSAYLVQSVIAVVGEIGISLIPIANVAIIVARGIYFVTLVIVGWFPMVVLTIILNFLVGIMFFLLAGIFLVRVCFLWILTILSPLAVVSYQSEIPIIDKFFEQWLKMLSEWLFVGIPFIFLLGLGFKLFSVQLAGASDAFANIDKLTTSIPEAFINYIFLFLYMLVVFLMSKEFMPTMGKQVVSTITGAATKTAQFMAPRMQRGINNWQVRTESRLAEREAGIEADKKLVESGDMDKSVYDQKYSLLGESGDLKLQKPFVKAVSGVRRYVLKQPLGAAQKMYNEDLKKQSEALGHLSAEQLQTLVAPSLVNYRGLKINRPGSYSNEQMAGILLGMKSKELHKFFDNRGGSVNDPMMQKIYSATISGNKDLKEKMERVILRGDGKDDERLAKIGNKKVEDVIKDATGEKALDISVKAMKDDVLNAIARNWTGNEIGMYAKKSNDFIKKINENFTEIDNEAIKSNIALHKYFEKGKIFQQTTPSVTPDLDSDPTPTSTPAPAPAPDKKPPSGFPRDKIDPSSGSLG